MRFRWDWFCVVVMFVLHIPLRGVTSNPVGKKLQGVFVVDRDFLQVRFRDGEVVFVDDGKGECAYQSCNNADNNKVVQYGLPLDTRFVWAHAEFTPRQTMRGKLALYGYLLGMRR